MPAPLGGDGSGNDGDAALALLVHPVGDGVSVVDRPHAVDAARVIEDALGGRGLARVDVGDDADVAQELEAGPGLGRGLVVTFHGR